MITKETILNLKKGESIDYYNPNDISKDAYDYIIEDKTKTIKLSIIKDPLTKCKQFPDGCYKHILTKK